MTDVALEMFTHDPGVETSLPDVLFVSGAGHSATCWDYMLPLFAEANFRTRTFNFRGRGNETVVDNRLQDYVDDFMSVVKTLRLAERRYVVVAHSMGGYVAQVALQQNEMPGLVGVILLSTMTPRLANHPLVSLRFLFFAARHGDALFDALRTRDFFSLISSQELVRYLFFSRTTPQSTVRFCQECLHSDSLRVMGDVLRAATPERGKRIAVPIQVIGASRDRIVPLQLLHKMAIVYGVHAEIFDSGHDVMLDTAYPKVATAMIQWIRERDAQG